MKLAKRPTKTFFFVFQKEQKKREEYIMRHRFMYPDLFGGHKLGDSSSENLHNEFNNGQDSKYFSCRQLPNKIVM